MTGLDPVVHAVEQKYALRREAIARRGVPDPEAADAIVHHILTTLILPEKIAATWPLPGEIDLRPLLHALHARGHTLLLPQAPPRGKPLVFRIWSPGTEMRPERFGTFCPDGHPALPDLILVPLLAWDRAGRRLGYGGGYYDRTLAVHPTTPRAGFALAAQEVPEVPAETHDVRLPLVITEHGAIQTQSAWQGTPLIR